MYLIKTIFDNWNVLTLYFSPLTTNQCYFPNFKDRCSIGSNNYNILQATTILNKTINCFEQNFVSYKRQSRSESSSNNRALAWAQGRRPCPNSDLWWKETSLRYVANVHELLTVSVTVRRASFNLSAHMRGAHFTCPPSDTNLSCLQRIN